MGQALTKKKKNKEIKFETKEEYFIRNGGILLEKQIGLSKGRDIGSGQIKLFSIKDIEKATNGFDPDTTVCSVYSTVYRATLENTDGIVAIKAHAVDHHSPVPELLGIFLTEALTGMVMSHRNIVKLHGCCLETCIPILLYKFLPNGSLCEHLHGATTDALKWRHRLRIATDVSYALSYMHNALPQTLVHRDVQSQNVLLDESLGAKLCNCGLWVSATSGEKPRKRCPVQGTPGCIDLEYVETREVTDKCDVYSFRVLMLELLITGRHPSMMARDGVDLVDVFVSGVGRNCEMEMIDKVVWEQGARDEIQQFIQLALRCVAKKGMERPSMIEVVSKLWLIQGQGRN